MINKQLKGPTHTNKQTNKQTNKINALNIKQLSPQNKGPAIVGPKEANSTK